MATKLKRYNIWLKIAAYIGLVALTCGMIINILNKESMLSEFSYIGDVNKTDYTDTVENDHERWGFESVLYKIYKFQDEGTIKSGRFVTTSDIQTKKNNMFYYYNQIIYDIYYNMGFDGFEITEKMLWNKFEEIYKDEIDNIQEDLISEQLNEYKYALESLKNYPYITYYINTDEPISNSDLSSDEILRQKYSYRETDSNKTIWAYSFSEDYINTKNDELASTSKEISDFIIYSAILFIAAVICALYLIYAAGKNASDQDGIHLMYIDRLYNEFTIGLLVLSFMGIILCISGIYNKEFYKYMLIIALIIIIAIFYLLISMLVRHIKARTLFKNTVIYTIFSKIARTIKKIYSKGTPMVKTVLLIIVLGTLTMIPFVGLITVPFAIWLAYRQVVGFQKLRNGIAVVKSGVYNQKIEIVNKSEFSALANDVNEISSGLSNEVDRRIKSERLKTELIVNVSHDIKTPLTSLITYADLLMKEETDNENIKKYVEVLSQKSNRLKILIDDLFESSKVASGNVDVNWEKLDIGELIAQGLAEMDDKIKASELDFITDIPEEKVFVSADGRLLWRVFQNLLSNVLKYSLKSSRVYINVKETEEDVLIEIKNISAAPLNIPEDEIMERFKRGDISRSSEGSGLGLDIAKSLMLCQNGELIIKIDGDLFKAIIKVCKYR